MAAHQQRWDILCRVVDNFGDIGVCWRLAKQLSLEYDFDVRLWVDDPATVQRLIPQYDPKQQSQKIHGITVLHWQEHVSAKDMLSIPDVVIEAFACDLPAPYLHAMAAKQDQPIWLNLEYLSAESWIEGFHLKPSPHPQLALNKTFFFPGWTEASGGLLREKGLLAARDNFQRDMLREESAIRVSLFCYPYAPIHELLSAMSQSSTPIHCFIPEGSLLEQVSLFFDVPSMQIGDRKQRGNLLVDILPFMPQDEYDQLLWSCDLNFVRGEDSWIRALWAGRPFIWQPYRQEEETHLVKLEAFLARYSGSLHKDSRQSLVAFHTAWAKGDFQAADWLSLLAHLPILDSHAKTYADEMAMQPDLASKLVIFCKNFS
ncbi:MAG: elongation factor P maturation arginine rhamnosyltransferase EarP [Nitrosomonadales bacterium]|nr:elongation factor P maturation arginine rhamnosyltransferase EarP [Nitrosomonadales bacterium]